MLYLILVVLLVSVGFLSARAARRRGAPRKSFKSTALRVGSLIALARLGVYWAGLALYTGHADWRQVAGYFLLMANSVVELALASSWSGDNPGPPLLVAALIVLTSAVLGLAWAWIRFRPIRQERPAQVRR